MEADLSEEKLDEWLQVSVLLLGEGETKSIEVFVRIFCGRSQFVMLVGEKW